MHPRAVLTAATRADLEARPEMLLLPEYEYLVRDLPSSAPRTIRFPPTPQPTLPVLPQSSWITRMEAAQCAARAQSAEMSAKKRASMRTSVPVRPAWRNAQQLAQVIRSVQHVQSSEHAAAACCTADGSR